MVLALVCLTFGWWFLWLSSLLAGFKIMQEDVEVFAGKLKH